MTGMDPCLGRGEFIQIIWSSMGKAIRWHNILDSHNPKYNGVEKY
jgi:hypothetical protein